MFNDFIFNIFNNFILFKVAEVAGYMTPVPGGVGPCTVACLLYNTVIAAKRQNLEPKLSQPN
jgi:5,10-methylene-tetrahydrofolate dehydrogenase/methenyl tetrahydrofolate cyclohydrolase